MELLLDARTILWWSLQPERLPARVLAELKNPHNRKFLSAFFSREAQITIGLGKLSLDDPFRKVAERKIVQNGWEVLAVTLHHAWGLEELSPLHRDPLSPPLRPGSPRRPSGGDRRA